jgi:D-amino-acid dehydrogenase
VQPQRHVETVVIGGGVIGACIAYELSQRGQEVLVVDSGEDVGGGCSYANAGLLSPGHVEPLTTPANVALGLRYLAQADGPFRLSPKPRLAPWLLRFLASSGRARAANLTARMRELAHDSLALHHQYIDAGVATGLRASGSLDVYVDETTWESRKQRALSEGERFLEGSEALDFEPTLRHAAGAVLNADDAMLESRTFVRAVLDAAVSSGGEVWWSTRVHRVMPHLSGALLDLGDRSVSCGTVVLAAGVQTRQLARDCGLRAPLEPGIGYVVDLPPHQGPDLPVTFKELKVVATPYADRLRLSGTMDLGARPDLINPSRVRALTNAASRGLTNVSTAAPVQVWTGQRPCLPDGVPMLGRSRKRPEVVMAAGHGMWGLILAPITGRLLAHEIATGQELPLDSAFAPDRFTWGARTTRAKSLRPGPSISA